MTRLSSATLTLSNEKCLRACPTTFNDKADSLAKETLYTIVSLDIFVTFVTFSNFFHSFKEQAKTEAERVEKSWNQNLRVKKFSEAITILLLNSGQFTCN